MENNTDDCNCAERFIDGVKQPRSRLHDCEYIRKRMMLIPDAQRVANKACLDDASPRWTGIFAEAMDRLSRKLMRGGPKEWPAD